MSLFGIYDLSGISYIFWVYLSLYSDRSREDGGVEVGEYFFLVGY